MKIRHLIDRARILASELSDTVRKAAQTQPSAAGSIQAICLEERVMMSASPMVDVMVDVVDEPASLDRTDSSGSVDSSHSNAAEQSAANQNAVNLVFVDESVSGHEQLIAELLRDPSGNMQIIILDSEEDGIAQITAALAGRSGIESIHIVSHGTDGNVRLGNTLLNSQTLNAYAGEIALWQSSLSADADFLFYGCNLAATGDGQSLLEQISALTTADVAASDDLTGHESLGGDWELEWQTGQINSSVIVTVSAQDAWHQSLALYTVTTTADSGAGSLRDAVTQSNASVGVADTINFGISGTGVHTINVGSSLTITDAVTINATTDDSFAVNSNRPAIILDGNNSFTGDGFVLTSTADGTTIRGFVIRDFTGDGIEIEANSNGNTIAGNYIGRLTATGIDAGVGEENTASGIRILSTGNTIGGTTTLDRNVISGNATVGINLTGAGASNNLILGNYIGTTATGLVDLGNTEDGIQLDTGASNNTIGGLTAASRNIISGNDNAGIAIDDAVSSNNLVLGNYIGLGSDGSTAVANTHNGINVNAAVGTVIGSTDSGGRNVISSNTIQGIGVTNATDTLIYGNYFGTDAAGTLARGNLGDGIRISGTAVGTRIGNTTAGAGNRIANNSGDGIFVSGGTNNSALGNLIYSNAGLGIDLDANGITANDTGDGDTGANFLQNFPVLTSATAAAAGTTIVGSLNSNANTTFRIEFYSNRPSIADASNGEGERYLGFVTVTTDGSGNATINTTLTNVWINAGDKISATATVDLGGGSYSNTSEFGVNITATSTGIVVVDTTSDVSDGTTTSITNLGNARGADGRISLREAIAAANSTANGGTPDKIVFNIGLTDLNHVYYRDNAVGGTFAAAVATTLSDASITDFDSDYASGTARSWYRITLGTTSLDVTQAVIIDGSTQASYDSAKGPIIEINAAAVTGGDANAIALTTGASTIRGLVINNADDNAIEVDTGAGGSTIAGNYVGTDVSGTKALGNSAVGTWGAIAIKSNNVIIGGSSAADRNLISGNLGYGIELYNSSTGAVIKGNYIGTTVTGSGTLGNSAAGIYIHASAASNTIGGTGANEGNIIANNTGDGIWLDTDAGTGTQILGNSFFSNTGLGIDLGANGVTANDAGDGDTGVNNLQNFPVLSTASTTGSQVTITGAFNSTASTTFRLEFFASTAADASGNGEGARYLGFADVTTNGSGNATINTTLTATVSPLEIISATATNNTNNSTSEFAQNIVASVITANSSSSAATVGAAGSLTWSHTVTSGSNRLLTVSLAFETGQSTGVTYGGVAMTLVGRYVGTHSHTSEIWQLVAPAVGTGNIVATFNGTRTVLGGADAFNNVNQTTPTGTFQGASADSGTASVNVSSAAGELVIDSLFTDQSMAVTGLAGQTEQWELTNGYTGAGSKEAGAATVTMSWTLGVSDEWNIGAVSIKPVVNSAPVVTLPGAAQTFTEGGAVVVIDSTATVTDSDSADFDTGTFTVSITANVQTGDRLLITNQGTGAGQIGVSGANVTYGGVTIGTFTGGTGAMPLVITFNSSATPAATQALARVITFSNVDTDPSTLARTVQFFVTDGDGGTSAAVSETVNVTGDNILVVTTAADTFDGTTTSIDALLANKGADGRISLREAILATNNTAGTDTIRFNIPEALVGGVHTITLAYDGADAGTAPDALPDITQAIIIDGWSEPDYAGTPVIELNGNNAGTGNEGFKLIAGSSGSTIRGFIINRFTGNGIEIDSSNNHVIEGNWIGLSNTGLAASASEDNGIMVTNSTGLMIGGTTAASRNVIAGNSKYGILFDNADSSTISGNYIGTNFLGSGDVNGTAANTLQTGVALSNGSSGNVVGGSTSSDRNVISGNNHYGIEILGATSQNNLLQGNYIGTTATGLVALGNTNGGVSFWGAGTGNRIGSSVISGNTGQGILVGNAASGSTIQGNFIGVGADGSTVVGNTTAGISIESASINTLVGTNADGSNDIAERNIISGNTYGIRVIDVGTTGTIIAGNYVGLAADGNTTAANSSYGVGISGNASNNTIGGATSASRNVISGNTSFGVYLGGAASSNSILSNYIGTNAAGTSIRGNLDGVWIDGSTNNTIGQAGAGNVISGSTYYGITVDGAGATGNSIRANLIGLDATGTVNLGNGAQGILVSNGAGSTSIGGIAAGQGNTIAFNTGDGIFVSAGTSNSILGNSIYSNTDQAIDLGTTGVTANDVGDGDTGANALQNFPVLTTAITNGTQVTITGTFNSTASTTFRIEFFSSITADGTGYGEGQTYLGFATISTDGSGNATINSTLAASVSAGEIISATATNNTTSNTSEFAQNVTAITDTNDAPVFTSLNGTPGFTEGGSAVVLDSNVTIFDAELSALNNFSGATLTLVRNGGASAQDVYSATGTLSALTQGGSLVVGGTTVGTVTTNSAGTLVLTFNSNATNALVNSVMQQIAYSNNSDTPPATAQINWTFNDSNSGAQGTGGALSATGNTVVSITATNDQAAFTSLNGTPTFTEGGAAVVFDSNVTIFDAELSALNNFSGATLTLVRNGGANSQDVYSATGTLSALTQGGSLVAGGTTIGTVTTNSSGTLVLTFNASATNALVNAAMQQIAYSNNSDTPPATAQINWTFNDTNSGAQGTGGALTATGNTTVSITPTNDAPTLITVSAPVVTVNEDAQATITFADLQSAGNEADVDGTVTSFVVKVVSSGTLLIGTSAGTATAWAAGTNDTIDATRQGYWTAALDANGTPNAFTVVAKDNGGLESAAPVQVQISVTAVNDAPVRTAGTVSNLTVLEDSLFTSLGFGSLSYGPGGGADESGQTITFDVTAVPTGLGNIYLADGTTLVTTSSVLTLAELQGLQFRTTTNVSGTSAFQFNPTDSGGTANGGVDNFSEFMLITVTQVNDAPTLSASALNPNFTEAAGLGTQAAAVNVFGSAAVATIESSQRVTGLTFTVSGLLDGANEVIVVDGRTITLGANSSGTTVTNGLAYSSTVSGGTATIVLSGGSLTTAVTQTLVNGITYQDTNTDNPTAGNRVLTLTQVTDNGGSANGGSDTTTLSIVSTVAVTAVNDQAAFTSLNGTPTLIEGGAAVVFDSDVTISDAELSAANNFNGTTLTLVRNGGANSQDVYSATGTLSALTQGGSLVVGGTTVGTVTTNSSGTLVLTFNASATNALVNSAMQQIAYSNNSDAPPTSAQINWTFNDNNSGAQGTGGALTATGNTVVTITSVNDAPILDNIGSMTLTAITEDQTANSGQTVASIIVSAGGDRITDVDSGAVEGIAITTTTNGNGSWEYSINGGSNWLAVGSVTNTSALLLRSTDLVRFVPNGQNATAGDITFRAWDQTGATAGQQGAKVDVSTNGGSTAFSTATEVASITVTAVNDAPVLDGSGVMSLTTITEDDTSTSGNTIAQIIASAGGDRITDVDSGAIEGIALFFVTGSNGTWQYNTGSGWTDVGTVSASSALLLRATDSLRFLPDGLNSGTGTILFQAWDQTSGTFGTKVDTSISGTTTAFSASVEVASITVTAVNDAPVLSDTALSLTVAEDAGVPVGVVGSLISAFTGGVSDVDSSALKGIAITASVEANGTWFYTTNNGTNWTAVGSVNSASSLLLADDANTRLYFAPNANYNGTSTSALTIRGWDQTNGAAATKVDTSSHGGITAFSSATDVVDVSVTSVLDYPNGTDNTVSTNEDTGYAFSVADFGFNDPDAGDSMIGVIINTLPAAGTLRLNGTAITAGSFVLTTEISSGLLLFTPTQDGNGSNYASFTFSVFDSTVLMDQSPNTMTINVTAVNDEQVLSVNTGATVLENSTGNVVTNIMLLTTDVDNTSGQLVYTVTATAANGTLRRSGIALGLNDSFTQADINAGLVTYDHNSSETSSDSFSFSIDDGTGSASSGTFNFTITPINDNSPVITSNAGGPTASINVAENTTAVTTVTATDGDLPAQTLTHSISGADSALFAIDSNTGVLTFVSGRNRELHTDADMNGVYEVTVQVSDGTLTDSQAISVTINDVDEFDVSNPADVNAAANAVNENAANGTVVGVTANSSDADATTNTVSYSLTDSAAGRFAIDVNTGVVTVADGTQLNREAAASHNITVRATSTDGSTADSLFTINLNDVDEFDVTNPIDTNAASNAVNENAANGTVVGVTATASDADSTTNVVTYSLTDSAGGRFAIDANTGVVTVADGTLLNRELAASLNITVRAISADSSTADTVFTININDVDEFNVGAVTDTNASVDTVAENATIGAAVGITAFAEDQDATNNAITYTLDDNAGGLFAIDSTTGVVTVAGTIDRETAASYNITVRATSTDTSSNTRVFSIAIGDVDEFDVSVPTDTDAVANQINENVIVGTTVGVTANAFDLDSTNNTITYSLTSNPDGLFQIDVNTGMVTTAAAIDRETHGATRSITVQAASSDGSVASQSFNITLNDQDEFDVGSVTDSNASTNSVVENASVGAVAGLTAFAQDLDATTSAITYTLIDSAGGRFAIDANTGVVTVADGTLLDREATPSHNISVRATSSDGSTADSTFTINLNDVDEYDVSVPSDVNGAANTVAEDATIGTSAGLTALAIDADATTNALTYSLDDNAGGRFAIDATTGIVTVASALDYETATSHTVTVRGTSADGSFATQVFTINVTNVNEGGVGPVSDVNAVANTVAENSPVGTTVGVTANATDPDAPDTVTYTLDDDAGGRFAIDANTGVVTVAGGINRESAGSYSITVRATSSDTSFGTLTLGINISDVDEFDVTGPVDSNVAINSVNENAANGTVVGVTASATDADATNNTVTYSLTDSAGGRFAIDANTGVVTVADGTLLDREAAASHNITVRATSADGSTADSTFTINVNDINESPTVVLTNQTPTLAENTNTSAGIKIADILIGDDALGTNLLSLSGTDAGSFEIVAGELRLRAGVLLDFETKTQYDLIVSVDDPGSGATPDDSVSYTLSISDLDDTAPVIQIGQMFVVDENSPISTILGSVIATDTDTTSPLLGWTIVAGNDDNHFAIRAADGTITVANNTNLNFELRSTYILTLTVSDGVQFSSPETIVIRVNNINEAPAAAAETFVTGQFEGILAMQPGVLANDFDEDGDALSAVLVAGPAHGTLILNPDGSFQYSPIGNFFGTDSFVYLASDGLLASGLAMVEVIVTPLGTPTGPSGGGGPANPPGVVVTTVTVGTAIDSSLDPDGGLNPDAVDGSSLRSVKFNSLFNAAGDIIAPSDADEVLLEAVEADVSTESRNPFDYLRRKLQGLNSPAANRLSNSLDSFEALVSMPLNWLQSEQGFADQGAAFSYQEFVVGSSAITTTSLTVGYAFWLIRGGSLVASFVSSLPAWTSFDPLSIVKEFEEDHDSESLLNIVEQSGNNGCRQADQGL